MISYTARSTSLGSGYLIGVTRGILGRLAQAHDAGEVITGATSQNLFDNVRASESQAGDVEYRCFAVYNTNNSESAFNVKVYLAPVSHEANATSATNDSGSGATLTDSTIIATYADDFFIDGTLQIISGQGFSPTPSLNSYSITGYDDSLGKFTIDGDWNNGTPNTTTVFSATSKKASPNHNDDISFAIERHYYSKLDGSGIATDGGVTFLFDSTLPTEGWTSPTHFIGASILLLTGDGVDGIPKRIISYNPTTGRIGITGTFVNTGVSAGDLYIIAKGPTQVLIPTESTEPPVGTGNLSDWSQAASVDEALSINVNGIGEDLIHNELFFIWLKRNVLANTESFSNDNIIPSIYFEI